MQSAVRKSKGLSWATGSSGQVLRNSDSWQPQYTLLLEGTLKHFAIAFLAGLAFSATSLLAAPITPAITFGSFTSAEVSAPFTLGYEFKLSNSYQINALGYYNDGNGASHQVGIWDTAGNLLVSTTVTGTDPGQNDFLWESISSVTLGPGTYVIGGQDEESGAIPGLPGAIKGVATLPGFTWIQDRFYGAAGFNFPAFSTGGTFGTDQLLAVNFSATPAPLVSTTPEPSSLLLMGSGLLGFAGLLRRKFRA